MSLVNNIKRFSALSLAVVMIGAFFSLVAPVVSANFFVDYYQLEQIKNFEIEERSDVKALRNYIRERYYDNYKVRDVYYEQDWNEAVVTLCRRERGVDEMCRILIIDADSEAARDTMRDYIEKEVERREDFYDNFDRDDERQREIST